ncbi:MAG: NAD-dependent epimerase/dehydratase family protein [Proteobacteria bacterium]|nr:NAD-dependent epimerase/dehydratase family protein [Pseudomonadota bacterium]
MADPVLVLGASGFVGRGLTHALTARGECVIAVSRHASSAFGTGVEVHVMAGREPGDFLPLLQRCRAVVHVASASTPGSSVGRPVAELDENLRPTLALLQAMQEHSTTPLLYVSSGGSLYDAESAVAANESSRLAPRSYHGAGKIAAENFIAAWCAQYQGSATILRPSNLYGPGQTERAGFGIIPAALGRLMRNETLHVWGDGTSRRDYLYIDDFLRLCLSILDASPVAHAAQVLNASSGSSFALNSLFGLIEKVTGRTLRREYDATRAVDMRYVEMRADLACSLGWSPQVDLDEGLARTWAWFSTTQR